MKQQPINKLFRAALLTAALALLAGVSTSCSKEQTQEPGAGATDGVIRIGGSSICITAEGGEAGTKAVVGASDMLDFHFIRKDFSSAALQNDMSGGTIFSGERAGDATGAITWHSAPYYNKDNSYAHLVGFYPGPMDGGIWDDQTQQMWWIIDGKTDIITSARTSMGTYVSPSTESMQFYHRLGQLEVIVRGQEGVPQEMLDAIWGNITRIEWTGGFHEFYYKAALAGTNDGLSSGDLGTYDLPLLAGATYQDDFAPIPIPVHGSANASAVAASGMFSPWTGTFPLRIHSTNGAPADVTVQLESGSTNKDFEAGKKHTVTLLLGAPDRKVIVADTQVTPWGTGGDGNGSATPPATAKAPNKGYLDWNNSALLKTGSFNGQTYTIPLFNMTSYNALTTASNGGKYLSVNAAIEGELPYITLEVAKTEETGTGTGWETTTVQTEGKGNASGTGGTYVNVSVTRANWATAYAACKAKGAGWRLPRLSELVEMSMNKTELNKTSGITAFSNLFYYYWRPPYTDSYGRPQPGYWTTTTHSAHNTYWAATEGYGATAWSVNVNGSSAGTNPQTSYFRVRCVKEL